MLSPTLSESERARFVRRLPGVVKAMVICEVGDGGLTAEVEGGSVETGTGDGYEGGDLVVAVPDAGLCWARLRGGKGHDAQVGRALDKMGSAKAGEAAGEVTVGVATLKPAQPPCTAVSVLAGGIAT